LGKQKTALKPYLRDERDKKGKETNLLRGWKNRRLSKGSQSPATTRKGEAGAIMLQLSKEMKRGDEK